MRKLYFLALASAATMVLTPMVSVQAAQKTTTNCTVINQCSNKVSTQCAQDKLDQLGIKLDLSQLINQKSCSSIAAVKGAQSSNNNCSGNSNCGTNNSNSNSKSCSSNSKNSNNSNSCSKNSNNSNSCGSSNKNSNNSKSCSSGNKNCSIKIGCNTNKNCSNSKNYIANKNYNKKNSCTGNDCNTVKTTPTETTDTTETTNKTDTTDTTEVTKPTENTSNGSNSLSYEEQILKLVNEERAKEGLSKLTMDATISKAALVRAKEIVSSFSHTRPNGSSFSTVLTENGVKFNGAGENLAWGQMTPQEVMNGWMNSSGHRANILNSKYKSIGIGYYESGGRNYWVQLFTY